MSIILSVATIIITFVASVLLMDYSSSGYIGWFWDFRTLFVLLILCIPILLAAGVLKELYNGIRLAVTKKKPAHITEVKRAIQAIKLTMAVLGMGAILLTGITATITLHTYYDPDSVGWILGRLLLFGIYASAIIILLLPIKARLDFRLIELIHSTSDETVPEMTAENPCNPDQDNE